MQCILRTPNSLAMVARALEVALLFSFVTALLGLPAIAPVPTRKDRVLSTELQLPSLNEKERLATIFVINLYAVKNSSNNVSKEMFENEIVEAVPDILEPLATVLLVIEDNEDEEDEKRSPADLDEFAEGLKSQGFKVDKINRNGKTKVLRMNLEETEAQSMIESARKPIDEKRTRQKRAFCLKCGGGYGGGHGGGHGGGYYPGGGGSYYPPSGGGGSYYPPSGGGGGYQKVVIPVVVLQPAGGHHHGGGGRPHYPSSGGGGGRPHYPSSGGGGGGGCYSCGSGGGGGGGSYSQSQASAQASASSGSWGK